MRYLTLMLFLASCSHVGTTAGGSGVELRAQKLPPDAQALFDQAYQASRADNFDQARGLYEQALAQAPEAGEIWWEYSSALRALGFAQEALQAGWRTIALKPEEPGVWVNQGNTFMQIREWAAAELMFDKILQLTNDPVRAASNFDNLGFYALGALAVDVAEKAFSKADTLSPNNPKILADRGTLLLLKGQTDQSAKLMDRALAIAHERGDASIPPYVQICRQAATHFKARIACLSNLTDLYEHVPASLLNPPRAIANSKPVVNAPRSFFWAVGGAPIFKLELPASWAGHASAQTTTALTVELRATDPSEAKILMTFMPSQVTVTDTEIERMMRELRDSALSGAVEKETQVVQSAGPEGQKIRLLSFVTDKNFQPGKPGDFQYASQGFVQFPKVMVGVTILSSSKTDERFAAAVSIFQQMHFIGRR